MEHPTQDDYAVALSMLKETHPQLVQVLSGAHRNRALRLSAYARGARLAGAEELLQHLDAVESTFLGTEKLARVAFLIGRARDEFAISIDAALSGMHRVAHDAMRGVMEIEFLLRDFAAEPTHVDDWLACTPKRRYDQFRPAVLRQRHANRLGIPVADVAEAVDYKAHSETLHVSPVPHPFAPSGIDSSSPSAGDACFWDMFEHARRLLIAIHNMALNVGPEIAKKLSPEQLTKVGKAWERTQEMQQIYLAALIQATPNAATEEREN
jgi:hypothetical protein